LLQPLWKTAQKLLKKLKIEPPYDPAIPQIYLKKTKILTGKDKCSPTFTAVLFTIGKIWRQLRVHQWMNR